MTTRAAPPEACLEVNTLLTRLRESVQNAERHWFIAVLEGVGQWPLAEEEVDGRRYRYLVGGEAFDWLLLAERLCDTIADITSTDEREALVMHGAFPTEVSEEEFRRLLGPAKHRAHLNFLYGVLVEEALQLAVQAEVQKERYATAIWENGSAVSADDEVFNRIYGATRPALLAEFCASRGLPCREEISLADLREFTYWLFKYRVQSHDPARVASDTRKGLAELQRLEALRTARRHSTPEV